MASSSSQALATYDGGTRRRVIVLGCAASMVVTFLLRRYRSRGGGEDGKGANKGKGMFKSTSERTFRRWVGFWLASFLCVETVSGCWGCRSALRLVCRLLVMSKPAGRFGPSGHAIPYRALLSRHPRLTTATHDTIHATDTRRARRQQEEGGTGWAMAAAAGPAAPCRYVTSRDAAAAADTHSAFPSRQSQSPPHTHVNRTLPTPTAPTSGPGRTRAGWRTTTRA